MKNRKYEQLITSWINEHREGILKEWIELCKIPSVCSEAQPNAPFGVECAKALTFAEKLFTSHDFSTKLYADSGYVLAEHGDGNKTIGLFGHSDVVPCGDDWLFTKPFEPVIHKGKLIGRGVSDNKAGIIASLCIMQILRDCKIPLHAKIQTFIGSNEESGMQDVIAFVREQPMPDISFIPDSGFPCSVGERGIYRFWSVCETPLSEILSFCGGKAFNTVVDHVEVRIIWSAELERELREKTDKNKDYELSVSKNELCLKAFGVAKHAAAPQSGINAAYLAASLLANCSNLNESDRVVMKETALWLSSPYGNGLEIANNDSIFGQLTVANGMADVRDKKLWLSFDIRYGISLDADEIERHLDKVFGYAGWIVKEKNNCPGFSISKDDVFAKLLVTIFNEETGLVANAFLMNGGTYARYLKNAFAVGVCAEGLHRKTTPKLDFPNGHGGAHQSDEAIDLDGFFEAVRILTQYVIECDKLLN